MSLECRIIDLGKIRFKELEKKQLELAELRARNEIPDTILIAEHPPTITTGNTEKWNKVHVSKEKLKELGIDYHKSNRGGGAAALGPGQIVFYPVVDIRLTRGIWNYMRAIEEITHNFATKLGANVILGEEYNSVIKKPYLCVWHINNSGKKEKFLAQGYLSGKGITKKGGFTIYVDKRAHQYFNLIDHCGFKLEEVGATSFEEMLGYNPGIEKIKNEVLEGLAKKFNYQLVKEKEVLACQQ